ncbi:MAG: CdaR family protein [Bacteroidetes bacterium]|nr:CdaR family protein [Bacteroidota bacterium]
METAEPHKFRLKIFTDRKSMVIFVACLILSALFWLLLSLSEEYNEFVVLKVRYKNLPDDKVLLHQLPAEAKVLIKAKGFKILGVRSGLSQEEIIIDFKNINFQKRGDYYRYDWVNAQHLSDLSSPENSFSILSVQPDTFPIVMDYKLSKVLPVRFSNKSSFAQNLKIIGSVAIFPDSVHVTGARHLLNNLTYLYTDSVHFTNYEGPVEKQVKLRIPEGTTVSEGNTVLLKFLMQSLKNRSFELTITAVNVPQGEELKLLPGVVKVNFLATDSTYNILNKKDFLVTADYRDVIISQNKIEVHLEKFPAGIELPGLAPAKVEYILRQ